MKKTALFIICLLYCFSFSYVEATSDENKILELHTLENVSENLFDGVWIPFMQYFRPLNDAIVIPDEYANDFILISNKKILLKLHGEAFTKLPYKFENDAVLSILLSNSDDPIYISMRLISKDTMLYTLYFGERIQAEFFCSKKIFPN